MLSGRHGSAFGDYPALGAIVAHESRANSSVPPYVAVPYNPAFTWELGKSAFLGERCESFKAGDPKQQLTLSPKARQAFAINREPESLHDRYGRTAAGQSMLLARRLVESGVRFVTVNADGWDHHAGIFEAMDRKLPELDLALSALVEDMDDRGLLSETLLVVMSEFGRSPLINANGGRDHWPAASSVLFAGAGVKRGCVLGSTDRHGAYPTEQPVGPGDVAATILEAIGIDERKTLRNENGRPTAILDRGQAIDNLFA